MNKPKNIFTKPYIIAGPCSAETEEQVLQTAKSIKLNAPQVKMLRAGIWKPRTRPNSFEGVGEKALAWLKNAGKEVNLPVCTEVANASHVEKALKAEIDVLWIGARSTVSPFIVQEIADALKGINIPVLVKNPINPDLALWEGALERLANVGLSSIGAIHRGFSSYNKTKYRNVPNWEIPIELKRRMPHLPIICDPSHIGGDRSLVKQLATQAMNLQFDGLMIETHQNPENAWSDAAQQITPQHLGDILNKLSIKKIEVDNIADLQHPSLHNLRQEIDRLDNYVLELLAERIEIVKQIGDYKKANNIAIYQPQRWAYTVQRALEIGETNGLSEEFILALFQKIHKASIDKQSESN